MGRCRVKSVQLFLALVESFWLGCLQLCKSQARESKNISAKGIKRCSLGAESELNCLAYAPQHVFFFTLRHIRKESDSVNMNCQRTIVDVTWSMMVSLTAAVYMKRCGTNALSVIVASVSDWQAARTRPFLFATPSSTFVW